MITWQLEELNLELIFPWVLSRGSSSKKLNYCVKAQMGDFIGRGEVAPNLRYGENRIDTERFFGSFRECLKTKDIDSLESLTRVLESDFIDMPTSLRFGIEAAYLDLLSQTSEVSLSELTGFKLVEGVETLFSVPLMEPSELEEFYETNNLKRFHHLKVKIDSSESSAQLLRDICQIHNGVIGVDANEAFGDIKQVVSTFKKIPLEKIAFLEQPFLAKDHYKCRHLKKELPLVLMADESITSGQVYDDITIDYHAINIKLMKSGSFFKAKRQLVQARALGLKVMIGCMIESTLGIRNALLLASRADWVDLDGFLFIKNDPFGLLYEKESRIYSSDHH